MNFKPGDLVMVVKPTLCCGNTKKIGTSFVVSELSDRLGSCPYCGHISDEMAANDGVFANFITRRLIKIDPLTEQDKTETLQEITA